MPNYTTPLNELTARVNNHAPDMDLCAVLTETDPVRPYLAILADELAGQAGIVVDSVLWHAMVLSAAAGYAVGLADAFAGMDELTALTGSPDTLGES